MGGAVFDLTGGYSHAFLTGLAFNLLNLTMIGLLHLRQTRMGLAGAPA